MKLGEVECISSRCSSIPVHSLHEHITSSHSQRSRQCYLPPKDATLRRASSQKMTFDSSAAGFRALLHSHHSLEHYGLLRHGPLFAMAQHPPSQACGSGVCITDSAARGGHAGRALSSRTELYPRRASSVAILQWLAPAAATSTVSCGSCRWVLLDGFTRIKPALPRRAARNLAGSAGQKTVVSAQN